MKRSMLFLLGCIAVLILAACGKEEIMAEKELMEDISMENDRNEDEEGAPGKAEDDQAEAAETPEAPSESAADPGAESETEPATEKDYFIEETFTSTVLASVKDGSSPAKEIKIYLPPTYYTSGKSYPAVYFFHGFGDSMHFILLNRFYFNELMVQQGNKEFIVVEVSGQRASASQGSFWVNSPVAGLWEDYVIDEIVPYIDNSYRTIPEAASRGIAGFSMGGFASLNLAFGHPDVFSSVQSLCPGVLKEGSLGSAMNSWRGDNTFLTCYGQSFAPNEDKERLCDIPLMDGTPEDDEIIEKWEAGFGDWDEKLDAYLQKNRPLKSIQVIYGAMDYYKWIPEGCIDLSELMTEKEIDHTLKELSTGHNIPTRYAEEYFIPFFSENLVSE